MYIRRVKTVVITLMFIIGCLSLGGCDNLTQPQADTQAQEEGETKTVSLASGAYDSADRAILVEKNESSQSLTFFNLVRKKKYTLEYDGGAKFYDKYGSAISLDQLVPGEIVDILFLKEKKKLTSLQVSNSTWAMEEVSHFELDLTNSKMKIMNEWYDVSADTIILSDGKEVELMDVNVQDVLQVRGTEHDIHSIIVDKGHGYLRLTNDEYFIGGWIEVGQRVIQRIESDMLLVVPEGSYQVFLSHSGIEGVKDVVIARNQEVELDLGDIRKDDLVKYGNLIFTVKPEGASVYLDGKSVDVSRTVKAEYGLHQIMVKAEGYDTVIQYIKVSQASANVSITLDKEKDRTVSANSTTTISGTAASAPSGNTITNTTTGNSNSTASTSGTAGSNTTVSANTTVGSSTGYKVTITAPTGAEVYLNGTYVGVAPVSFPKQAGSHVITLRKTGYQSRSYSIEVDKEQKDISYSFSDLIQIG